MATVINKRDVALQAASPRTVTVNLGSTVNVNGTLDGTPVADVVTAAFSGGGTSNFFTSSASDPTGGASGDAHYNTTTQVMWFNVDGTWTKGGTVNASQITTGTLAAARIASNSITADMINASTLSAITANLGTVTAGSITGTSDISITGQGRFDGVTTQGGSTYAGVFNSSGASSHGVGGWSTTGLGVWGNATSGSGVFGSCSTGIGVKAQATGGGVALSVFGSMSISSTALVSNLNADLLDNKQGSSYAQLVVTDSGTCNISGNGFNLNVTGSLASTVRTRGTSNIVYIENISDERLKQEIEHEKYGLDFINSLKPRSFRMRADPTLLSHGLIYQEVAELLDGEPDTLACLNNDGTGSVDYNGMIAPIIRAIQELSKQLDEVRNEQKACGCCKPG